MRVQVERVKIPAMSSIGLGWGRTEDGRLIKFAGDHRMMRHLGEGLAEAQEPLSAEVEEWQVLEVLGDE